MEKKEKRNKILKVSGLIGLFLLVFGLSYALFTVTLNGTKKVKISTGRLELQLLDSNNNPIYITNQNNTTSYEINLDNQVPVSDEVGLDSTAFEFKLKNTGNIKASYTIYLDDVALESGESRIDDEYIRYSLTKNGSEDEAKYLTDIGSNPNRKLDKGTIEADNTTNEYTLKIWIAENATNEAMDKVFSATLRVEGTQYVQNGPFEEGTVAAELYKKGIVGEYNATTNRVPAGFNNGAETEESGLYKYTDEQGAETYAYRGPDVDNYVTFAETTWRIIRIQSDGSVKLLKADPLYYEDTGFESNNNSRTYNGQPITTVAYYTGSVSQSDFRYKNSNLESYINAWYEGTMSNYNSKIAVNEYCDDITEDHDSDYYNYAGTSLKHIYGLWNRIDFGSWTAEDDPTDEEIKTVSIAPSISCAAENIVESRVATITADEYILGGGGWSKPTQSYFLSDLAFWMMSPTAYNTIGYGTVNLLGYIYMIPGSYDEPVLPVITLKSNLSITSGDGSELTPYVIS